MELDQVVQEKLAIHRLTGFTVMNSWRGSLYQTVLITNKNVSLWISYDERDRWLGVSYLNYEDSVTVSRAKATEDSITLLSYHDAGQSLVQILIERGASGDLMESLQEDNCVEERVSSILDYLVKLYPEMLEDDYAVPGILPNPATIKRYMF